MIARHGSGTPRAASSWCSRRPGPSSGSCSVTSGASVARSSAGRGEAGHRLGRSHGAALGRCERPTAGGAARPRGPGLVGSVQPGRGQGRDRLLGSQRADLGRASGEQLAVLQGHEGAVLWAAFSPDGTKVVTGSSDGTARLWHAWSKPHGLRAGRTRRHGPNGAVRPERSADHHGRLRLDGSPLGQRGRVSAAGAARASDNVRSAAFDRRGARRHCFGRRYGAGLGNSFGPEIAILKGGGEKLRAAAFSPSGELIAAATSIGTMELWDLERG